MFPHHENEIAQSCSAFGHDVMANVWMHNGHLQVEGEKMSKSLGNFVTIHELLHTDKFGGRSWPGEVLRLAMFENALPPADRFYGEGAGGGGRSTCARMVLMQLTTPMVIRKFQSRFFNRCWTTSIPLLP